MEEHACDQRLEGGLCASVPCQKRRDAGRNSGIGIDKRAECLRLHRELQRCLVQEYRHVCQDQCGIYKRVGAPRIEVFERDEHLEVSWPRAEYRKQGEMERAGEYSLFRVR